MNKFTEFLNNMRQFDPVLIESVEKGFAMIFESTEDVVEDVKKKVNKGNVNKISDIKEELVDILEENPEEMTQDDSRITY